jgi:hypothetical protein
LSQAGRLFELRDNGLPEDLLVLVVINPHEVEAHGRAETERGAIVEIGPGDLAGHGNEFLGKLDSHRIGYPFVEPIRAIHEKAFPSEIPGLPLCQTKFGFYG